MIQFPLLSIEAFYWTQGKGLCRAHVDSWRLQRVFIWSNMLTADEKTCLPWVGTASQCPEQALPDASHLVDAVPLELPLPPVVASQERMWEVKGNGKCKASTGKLTCVFLFREHQNLKMTTANLYWELILYLRQRERRRGFIQGTKPSH